jgi:hypothetical protein
MGGQACVSYGAAEFSRGLDLAIVASLRNIDALRKAMVDLHAEVIAVPPFDLKYLRKGHAVHFRCHHPEVEGLRVDVMSRLRGVDSFERLWSRRTTIEVPGGTTFDLLSLPDLVQAKKTQRDKDWPMIRRLVEADFFGRRETASAADVRFLRASHGGGCFPPHGVAPARSKATAARPRSARRRVRTRRAPAVFHQPRPSSLTRLVCSKV